MYIQVNPLCQLIRMFAYRHIYSYKQVTITCKIHNGGTGYWRNKWKKPKLDINFSRLIRSKLISKCRHKKILFRKYNIKTVSNRPP